MKRLLSALAVILLLNACSDSAKVEAKDSAENITLSIGESTSISLKENPTTGYSWQFFLTPENQNVISDISENYIAPNNGLAGAGGIKEYKFKAANAGQLTIDAYYFRPWEKLDKQTADHKVFVVTVK